jgi:hypothetical protein
MWTEATVAYFKRLFQCLLTNQNDIRDEIKSRLNSGNACYYSVQNLLSSRLISKNLKIKIYKTAILPVVLYGCVIMNFTARILHRILLGWLNQGGWGGLDNATRIGEGRGVYRVFVERSEGKRPLGIHRRRWEDNIKMDLREIGIDGANWIQLAQDRVQWRACVNMVINLRAS